MFDDEYYDEHSSYNLDEEWGEDEYDGWEPIPEYVTRDLNFFGFTWFGINGLWYSDAGLAFEAAEELGWFDGLWFAPSWIDHIRAEEPSYNPAQANISEARAARLHYWRKIDRWSSREGKWRYRFYWRPSSWIGSITKRVNRRKYTTDSDGRVHWNRGMWRDDAKKRDKARKAERASKRRMNEYDIALNDWRTVEEWADLLYASYPEEYEQPVRIARTIVHNSDFGVCVGFNDDLCDRCYEALYANKKHTKRAA